MDPLSIIGYIALVIGAILTIFSRLPKQTIENQKDLIETYEKRLKALEDQSAEDRKNHLEQVKAIADLQGQIKVYKELPLQEMATAMQEISRVNKGIAESNTEILRTLKSSAVIAAVDRSELLHPTQNITKQTVETQVIKNKE